MKRIISIVITVVLVFGLFVVATSAENVLIPLPATQYFAGMSLNDSRLRDAYYRIVHCIEQADEKVSIQDLLITKSDLKMIMTCYKNDYPQHFWYDSSYRYSYVDDFVYDVYPSYSITGQELVQARHDWEEAVDNILQGITPDMSEYEREKMIHDRLALQVVYQESENAHNAYGALVEGVAVCEGYAKAFQSLLYEVGIQCLFVTGQGISSSGTEPHGWNLVKIDGQYYYVDLTWDDQNSRIFYAYFNVTTQQLQQDHIFDATPYELPRCTAVDANYFVQTNCILTTFGVEQLGALLKSGNGTASILIPDSTGFIEWLSQNMFAIAQSAGFVDNIGYGYSRLGDEWVLSVSGTLLGDANVDGQITLLDVMYIALACAEKITLNYTQQQCSDMNNDGYVTLADALLIAHIIIS